MPYSGRIHFFTFLKYENICKWYEKLTKNSNFDKNKNEKQQQHQRQEKKTHHRIHKDNGNTMI